MSTGSTVGSPEDNGASRSTKRTGELVDAETRRRIGPWVEDGAPSLRDFDEETNFLVRAAAGSGKTTALVARMVALVRRGYPVEELAAITFTRKAAGEMTARFYRELQSIQPKLEGTEKERVSTALQRLHGTYIGTIHGFCGRLLRENALAAGLPPDFSVGLEGREEREMRDRAWQQFLHETFEDRPRRVEHLQDLGVELEGLGPFFETLCKYPELELYTNAPPEPPSLAGAVEEAQRVLQEWQPRRPSVPNGDRDDAQKAFDQAEAMLKHRPLDTPAQRAEFLELFERTAYSDSTGPGDMGAGKVTLNRWNKEAEVGPKVLKEEELPRLVEEVIRPVLRPWHAYVHEEITRAVAPAIETYRLMRTEEGALSHHDVLHLTRDLLRDSEEIRAWAQERLSHLLVDEFQDTDPLQAQILFYLTSEDPGEPNWQKCVPRPGSLFIVGDDKQSIYRFRRADKAVFDAVARRMEELDQPRGEVVDLVTNFRSYGALCHGWNEVFGEIFADPKLEDLQADYRAFVPDQPRGADRTGLRQLTIGDVKGNWAKDIVPKEAERIARFIDHAVEADREHKLAGPGDGPSVFPGGAGYEDFLILTRTKARLSHYGEALARRGVPYTITGAKDLDQSPELRALVTLLEGVLKPDDPTSTVGLLRGLLGGLTDGELYQVRQAFDQVSTEPFARLADAKVSQQLAQALEDPLAERIKRASRLLRKARHHLERFRPGRALEKIIEETGLLASSAHPPSPEPSSLRAGRMLRVISYVRQRTEEGQDWADVLEALRDILDGEEEVESITLDTGRDRAVRVMNVHQAKGLEAPVVFLADPYRRSGGTHEPTHHVRRRPEEEVAQLVAPVVEGESYYQRVTYAPLGWHEGTDPAFLTEEKRHEEAEEKRLLYVAATRAERLLVVSRYETKPNSGPWADLYPHLDREEVPELVVPDRAAAKKPQERSVSLHNQEERRRKVLEPLRAPSYTEASVTEQKDGMRSGGLVESEGYGGDFGTAVHELLEVAIRSGIDPSGLSERHVRAALEEGTAEGTPAQVRRARRMLEAFADSGLPEALEQASHVYTEYPISGQRGGETPEIVNGVIDLLYQDEGGWHLVDYKTDWLGRDDTLEDVPPEHPYCRQVRIYAALWTQQMGEPLTSARLWFADVNRFVEVSLKS